MANQDNRVLIRKGARELSEEEVERVQGGRAGTQTACTFPGVRVSALDGDPGECGPL